MTFVADLTCWLIIATAGERCDRDHSTCGGRTELCIGRGPAWPDHFSSNEIVASRQAAMALRLWETANQTLSGADSCHHGSYAIGSLVLGLIPKIQT